MIDRMQQNTATGTESTWASDPVVALPQLHLCRRSFRRENINDEAKEEALYSPEALIPLCEIFYLHSDGSSEIRNAMGIKKLAELTVYVFVPLGLHGVSNCEIARCRAMSSVTPG